MGRWVLVISIGFYRVPVPVTTNRQNPRTRTVPDLSLYIFHKHHSLRLIPLFFSSGRRTTGSGTQWAIAMPQGLPTYKHTLKQGVLSI